ncbi:GNAT family N-acetyltransferase [uncultured Paludibaculum sp.]|uniref:GNAT family N-acetyltransferase n=1 Tax=uncultured Paludibaculum sp. TaxID=1765020 RepID=UPI002AAC29BF|nr:GNAT family N-acetyltransferase [uncultured Paludibaculum sp.]
MRLTELRAIPAFALNRLLQEEKARWLTLLHWDFTPSADLVTRYVAMQALDGFVLVDDGEPVGYVYWVMEDYKGLIGDLYVRDAWRSPANENMLMGAALGEMRRHSWIRRIEAQLMQLSIRGGQVAPAGVHPRVYPRHFMLAPTEGLDAIRPVQLAPEVRLENWNMRWLDASAQLISSVYQGHVDSAINDQYNSGQGARRFLQNIVQYPGCGHFSHAASWVALDREGRVVGLSLASKVATDIGHIAQLCLARDLQGGGAGYEMLRRSMQSLAYDGCGEVSLTVTASNDRAIRLYERFGFRAIYHFEALVWESLWS